MVITIITGCCFPHSALQCLSQSVSQSVVPSRQMSLRMRIQTHSINSMLHRVDYYCRLTPGASPCPRGFVLFFRASQAAIRRYDFLIMIIYNYFTLAAVAVVTVLVVGCGRRNLSLIQTHDTHSAISLLLPSFRRKGKKSGKTSSANKRG